MPKIWPISLKIITVTLVLQRKLGIFPLHDQKTVERVSSESVLFLLWRSLSEVTEPLRLSGKSEKRGILSPIWFSWAWRWWTANSRITSAMLLYFLFYGCIERVQKSRMILNSSNVFFFFFLEDFIWRTFMLTWSESILRRSSMMVMEWKQPFESSGCWSDHAVRTRTRFHEMNVPVKSSSAQPLRSCSIYFRSFTPYACFFALSLFGAFLI